MMDPPIETLLDEGGLQVHAGEPRCQAGREVNSYFNQLGEGLGSIVPPQVTSISRKPLSIALDEVAAGKITYHRAVEPDDLEGAEEAGSESSLEPRRASVTVPAGQARPSSLAGKRVVLGVCGGIAAYKAVELCRRLMAAGAVVSPVLTKGATRFVTAATFSALASEPARTSLFGAGAGPEPVPHTHLGRTADAVVVAPGHSTADRRATQRASLRTC